MKFTSIIVLSLLSITVSAVVIDRPSSSESTAISNRKIVEESLARIKQRKCKYAGDCSSTGTGQQSTETNHDVAQSTVDPNDSDNSVKQSKQSNESSSSSQSEQSDDNDCSFFNSHISKNEQSSLTPRQKLDRIERMMRKIGMDIPTGAEDTRKIDAEVKQRVQETKKKGHIMAPSDRRNLMRLKLERSWICYNLELESFNEMSINAVSEPTPETSESTSKPHGSKQGFFKTHQSKSNRQENQSTLSAWKLKLKIKKPKLPKLTVYSKSMFGN
ncbi:hypothetical protein BDEG_28570 [Batrachochytrium dendrobatidis JEL423]|uniref:Uncharacterized protein n=1 Tax=Batrachochytrium dendrobatidis (strain JEL423) TaxID=403673 RepID=A0A177X195_BATDL|nr:hypothetical protein BDEG_28570 [Batrachochytrium dendrobatidis JEL423]